VPGTMTETGLYLYGITKSHSSAGTSRFVRQGGVKGADVEQIVEGPLAAVVSRVAAKKLRPDRTNLAAHHQVLRDLTEHGTVLPTAFGTIAGSEQELRALLCRNQSKLLPLFERLEGKVEMTLKVYWDTTNIFEFFVAQHDELKAMRDRLFRPGCAPTVNQKIEIGEQFESLLEQSRKRHTQRVIDALSRDSVEIRTNDLGDERMIMKLACLVEKDRQQHWEDGIQKAARLFDDHYRFAYSGPFTPQSFADIHLAFE